VKIYHLSHEDVHLLRCDAVLLGEIILLFWKNYGP